MYQKWDIHPLSAIRTLFHTETMRLINYEGTQKTETRNESLNSTRSYTCHGYSW